MGYRKTYFRIDSLYCHGESWSCDGAAEAFHAETRELFQMNGWTLKPGNCHGVGDTVVKEQQDLYLHPMNFSGVVREEEIPTIETFLAEGITFRCRGVDCYETFLDLSDAEYRELLESKREEITAAILGCFTTKRRNLYYINPSGAGIAERFSVCRLCDKEKQRDLSYSYVAELIAQMIQDGRLITANVKGGVGIRTAVEKKTVRRVLLDDGQLSLLNWVI